MSKSMYSLPSASVMREPRASVMNSGYGAYAWNELATPSGMAELARSNRAALFGVRCRYDSSSRAPISAMRARSIACPVTVTVALLASSPLVAFLHEPKLDECLGRADAVDPGELLRQHAQQMVVVLAHDLAEQVVAPRGDDHIRHLVQGGDLIGDGGQLSRIDLQTDERRLLEPHRQRVGDADHLHHAAADEALRALPDRRLGNLELSSDLRVRAASVELETLDDRLVEVVEDRASPAVLNAAHRHARSLCRPRLWVNFPQNSRAILADSARQLSVPVHALEVASNAHIDVRRSLIV